MSDAWYYGEGDKSIGPITLADLIAILSRVSDGQSVFVWRDGLVGWVQAKKLPELAPHVTKPPPLPIKGAIPEIEGKELKLTWLRMMRAWWACLWRFWIPTLAGGLFFLYLPTKSLGEVSEKSVDNLVNRVLFVLMVIWCLFLA
jgi:GYF domain 2